MLNYTDVEIEKILLSILNLKSVKVEPVGNHHLKRHLVYKISLDSGEKYIFKLYYKDRRRSREIASLRLFEDSDILCPRIFSYGILEDGSQWLITEFIQGEILHNIMEKVSENNRVKIFNQMGEELGKLHSFKAFDFFGEWDINGKSIRNIDNYYKKFVDAIEKAIDIIESTDLPNKELLIIAIKEIRDSYSLIDINITSRLVHNDFDGRNILVIKTEGEYRLSGIIDFEGASPGNPEEDFISLYFKYFLSHTEYERSFLKGYKKVIDIKEDFQSRLRLYLLAFIVENCSWAYVQAPDYYEDNINLLKILINRDKGEVL